MSKYTDTYDFKDLIHDNYFDSWEIFKTNTDCKLFIHTDNTETTFSEIDIKSPADLILFYPCTIDHIWINPDTGYDQVYLNSSVLAKELSLFKTLNGKYGSKDFKPFRDNELLAQYNQLIRLYLDNRETTVII